MRVDLFVICRDQPHERQYWAMSSEHGCGWCDRPKQSFSPSELRSQLAFLVEKGWIDGATVRQLDIANL